MQAQKQMSGVYGVHVPYGFRHPRQERIERVERREIQVVLARIFRIKSASMYLQTEAQ
jgi:hypothetical protein